MINDPYTALNYILQSNSTIISLLGKYLLPDGTPGTTPLIMGGVLPETETDLPCITFYNNNDDQDFNLNDSIFTVNCYAGDTDSSSKDASRNSFLLARTVVKELKGLQTTAGGYPVTTTARILTAIPDPTAREVNTTVEVRLFNIGGAL